MPAISTSAFHLTYLFLFTRHYIPTNSVAPFLYMNPHTTPQLLQSLRRSANVQNASF